MENDSLKICDFGIVHSTDQDEVIGMVVGTLPYMAPELLKGMPPAPATDIFALGIVCYEVLTTRNPFSRPTESETIAALNGYNPSPVYEVNETVNELVSFAVDKAINKNPAHRFLSARDFGLALQNALANLKAATLILRTNPEPLRNETTEGLERGRTRQCIDGGNKVPASRCTPGSSTSQLGPLPAASRKIG
jgi:serine/threonine protein kinase